MIHDQDHDTITVEQACRIYELLVARCDNHHEECPICRRNMLMCSEMYNLRWLKHKAEARVSRLRAEREEDERRRKRGYQL